MEAFRVEGQRVPIMGAARDGLRVGSGVEDEVVGRVLEGAAQASERIAQSRAEGPNSQFAKSKSNVISSVEGSL